MGRFVRVSLFSVLVLGLALLSSPVTRADDDDEKVEKENIEKAKKLADPLKKLVDAVESGKDKDTVAEVARELDTKEKYGLKIIMWAAYKPREKGGMGVGPKAVEGKSDGIEVKLIKQLRRKDPMSPDDLKKESDDLIKMAVVAKSMAEIADRHTPEKNDPLDSKKTIANWKKFNQLTKDSAKDLIEAVKANKPDKALDATKNLYSSCTNCHSTFRD
jgi:cytochrome c556